MVGVLGDIELCVPALRRHAGALLRDRAEADDLVHTSLLRALDRLGSLSGHENVRVGLFATLHSVFASRAWRSARGGHAKPTGSARSPNELMRALDALTQEERAVLLLVCVEDLSYGEVSRVLSISLTDVMTRLSSARQQLWQCSAAETRPSLGRVE
jgi:RNA polymerase sigma-70 factor (ECF subfamily)